MLLFIADDDSKSEANRVKQIYNSEQLLTTTCLRLMTQKVTYHTLR